MRGTRLVALLGRRDEPTDGVTDYCVQLGEAMKPLGYQFELFRVDWAEQGWRTALATLRGKAASWQGSWVLLQYTTLAWSLRGFPLRTPSILDALRENGLRCGVVFHDFEPLHGTRWIDHARHFCQLRVLQSLYKRAERAIFPIPLDKVSWLPAQDDKPVFIPVGANCPELSSEAPADSGSDSATDSNRPTTVAVYGVTGGTRTSPEIADISASIKRANRAAGPLRVVVFGRGSSEAGPALQRELAGSGSEVEILGLLSAHDVSRTLGAADVLLFVRGQISSRRGSAIAGIACGLPVVCYAGPDTDWPITEAGIFSVPLDDREALSAALETVLSDVSLRNTLSQRSCRAQEQYFSWNAIAVRLDHALREPGRVPNDNVVSPIGRKVAASPTN